MATLNFNSRELGEEVLRRLDLSERLDALARIADNNRTDSRIFVKDVDCPIDADLPHHDGYRDGTYGGKYVTPADVADSARRHRSMAESLTMLAQVAATVEGNEATSCRHAAAADTTEQQVAHATAAHDDSHDDVDGM